MKGRDLPAWRAAQLLSSVRVVVCHSRDPLPALVQWAASSSPGEITSSCLCPNITTNNEEMHRPTGPQHRAEFEAVKNPLQLQPHKPGALHCLAQESASRRFLLPGGLAWLALRALLLCHKRVLALRHRHRGPSRNHRGEGRSSPGKGEQLFSS